MADMEKMSMEELQDINGGVGGFGRSGFKVGTVHDVVAYDDSACLTLRDAPDGNVQYTAAGKPIGWQNGDSVQVQPSSRTGHWIKAVKGTKSGWVDTNYVWY